MLQTTCCIQSGASGGAVLRDGKLLGSTKINTELLFFFKNLVIFLSLKHTHVQIRAANKFFPGICHVQEIFFLGLGMAIVTDLPYNKNLFFL